jgi:predicted signal transduction protein with EAL and GGDEF domain
MLNLFRRKGVKPKVTLHEVASAAALTREAPLLALLFKTYSSETYHIVDCYIQAYDAFLVESLGAIRLVDVLLGRNIFPPLKEVCYER